MTPPTVILCLSAKWEDHIETFRKIRKPLLMFGSYDLMPESSIYKQIFQEFCR